MYLVHVCWGHLSCILITWTLAAAAPWTTERLGGDEMNARFGGGGPVCWRWGSLGTRWGMFFFRGKTPTKNRGQIMNNLETNMVKPSAPTSGMRCGTSTWSQSLEIPDFGFCLPSKSMGNSTHSAGIWHLFPQNLRHNPRTYRGKWENHKYFPSPKDLGWSMKLYKLQKIPVMFRPPVHCPRLAWWVKIGLALAVHLPVDYGSIRWWGPAQQWIVCRRLWCPRHDLQVHDLVSGGCPEQL